MSKLLQAFVTQIRSYQKPVHLPEWKPEAVKYGHIKYYPRHPDHQDPPIEPTKLLLVERIKPYKFNPYWDKAILDSLGLNERGKNYAIVKNTPSECARLWRIKHLIRVRPLKTPEKLSEEITELGASYLCDNGTLKVIPKVDPVRIESTDKFINNEKKMDKVTIKRQLRLKWLNPME